MLCGMPSKDGPPARPHRRHEELLLELLRKHGSLSRSRLNDLSGLSRTTLYDVVAQLVDDGAVVVSPPDSARRRRGRPAEKLTLAPEAGRAIGRARRSVRVTAVGGAAHGIGPAAREKQKAPTRAPAHAPAPAGRPPEQGTGVLDDEGERD
jgi:hypothetical protein